MNVTEIILYQFKEIFLDLHCYMSELQYIYIFNEITKDNSNMTENELTIWYDNTKNIIESPNLVLQDYEYIFFYKCLLNELSNIATINDCKLIL